MIRFLLLCALILVLGEAPAQEKPAAVKARSPRQVALLYNLGHIGHNLSLDYRHYFGRHAITAGAKYHLATQINNRDSRFNGFRFKPHVYHNPAASRAGSFRERIGLNLGYQFRLLRRESWLTPYLFYQLQASFSLPAYLGAYQVGSYTAFENAFGVALQPVLWRKWRLDVGVGIGPAVFFNEQLMAPASPAQPGTFRERLLLLRAGVVYDL